MARKERALTEDDRASSPADVEPTRRFTDDHPVCSKPSIANIAPTLKFTHRTRKEWKLYVCFYNVSRYASYCAGKYSSAAHALKCALMTKREHIEVES